MKKLVVALCLACSLAVFPGCKELIPLIPKIVAVLADATSTLQIIDTAVEEWFDQHPDVDPKVRAEYRLLYAKCHEALNGANHALQGAEDLTQNDYDAAFAEFKAAYIQLRDLLYREGIASTDGKLGAAGATVDVPEPMALTYRVQ